jgi:hypothetical protein
MNRRELMLVAGAGAASIVTGTDTAAGADPAGARAHRVASNTTANVSTRSLGAAMRPGVSDLRKGKYPGLGYEEREKQGILIQKDVAIPVRDGAKLYANIYRPRGRLNLPAIICDAPFGKHPHIDMQTTFAGSGVPFDKLSNETIFEVFDPLKWGQDGYALIIVDGRGNWSSTGEALFFSPEEARDGYDVVEWAGTQAWSNGKVGVLLRHVGLGSRRTEAAAPRRHHALGRCQRCLSRMLLPRRHPDAAFQSQLAASSVLLADAGRGYGSGHAKSSAHR